MKRFLLTVFLGMLAFSALTGMFLVKYHVMNREHYLIQLQRQINKNNRSIHILKAEWANLTDPKRIQVLVEQQTDLKPLRLSQVIEWNDIDRRYERTVP